MATDSISQNGSRYRVERTYRNFVTGETWTQLLPDIFKTRRGAENRAQANRWVTMPDRNTRIDDMSARVIPVAGSAQ